MPLRIRSAQPQPLRGPNTVVLLTGLGCVSWLIYLAVARLSQSLHEAGTGKHSLLVLLGLFAAAFACYLAAVRVVVGAGPTRRLLAVIVTGAIAFRITLLFSDPIEEIDLYRYLWDGEVLAHGVSPFRYSPQQVLEGTRGNDLPQDLDRLVALRDASPTLTAVLRRIHFGQLPTIYPPVSQAVFALSALLTPPDASIYGRMIVVKTWFVGCDLITFWVVIRLVVACGMRPGLSVAYGWCPLVIKEVANSGHVDALAVCLAAVSAWLAVRSLFGMKTGPKRSAVMFLAFAVLGLAVGAKLYPLILLPLFGFVCARRLGWWTAVVAAAIFGMTALAAVWPMIPKERLAPLPADPQPYAVATESIDDFAPPAPPLAESFSPRDPSQSLRVFLGHWEMNDFLFLIVVENLRPQRGLPAGQRAWFSFIPESWRATLIDSVAKAAICSKEQAPFLITRGLLSLAFIALALQIARRAAAATEPSEWLRGAFITLAWFWLLLPTANPWYLTWCLPFLPFAKHRAWLALSGLALLYYLRFWLAYQFADTCVLGTPYNGAQFFDYIVTWIEFAPWLCCLAAGKHSADAVLQILNSDTATNSTDL